MSGPSPWRAAPFASCSSKNLGRDAPTILLTNERRPAAAKLITRYAPRMLISAVGLKVDFDMALLVIASGLYQLLARRMRGYADAQACA